MTEKYFLVEKYAIRCSLLISNIPEAQLGSIETVMMFDSHLHRGGTSTVNVAEKLQTIKIVVWAI